MSFDATKVQFSQEELDRIKDADEMYEIVAPALKDGLGWGDVSVVGVILAQGRRLVEWLMTGTKAQLGYKLIALGAGLIRDNEFLGDADAPVE